MTEVIKLNATDIHLTDDTAFPYIIKILKEFYLAYKQTRYNCWEYEIFRFGLDHLDKPVARAYLAKHYNEHLHSLEPANPFVIDATEERFIKIIKKKSLESKILSIPKSKKIRKKNTESLSIAQNIPQTYSIKPTRLLTRTEKVAAWLDKNLLFILLNKAWYAISSNATLIKWIFFIGFVFALPVPYICLTYIAVIFFSVYLATLLVQGIKKNISPNLCSLPEEKAKQALLVHAKKIVFRKLHTEKYLVGLQNELASLGINPESFYKNVYLTRSKNTQNCIKNTNIYEYLANVQDKPNSFLNLSLDQTTLYQYLDKFYPKTQFITSLVTNLIQIALYNYLIAWTISIICMALKATAFAALISSPPMIGALLLVSACFFLSMHFIQHQARENFYQGKITNLLTAPCELICVDNNGSIKKINLKKWEKFEYLKQEYQLLALELDQLIQNDNFAKELYEKILALKHTPLLKNNFIKKTKKILYRVFFFLFGIFYGVDLGLQISLKSSLMFTLFFPPLIIINGIANLLTYHFNARQRKCLLFAEEIDIHTQKLEHKIKLLSMYIASVLSLKELATTACKNNASAENTHITAVNSFIGSCQCVETLAQAEIDPQLMPVGKFFTSQTPFLMFLPSNKQEFNFSDSHLTLVNA